MAFPTKMYFSLSEVSARWHRQTKDVEYCIENGLLNAHIKVCSVKLTSNMLLNKFPHNSQEIYEYTGCKRITPEDCHILFRHYKRQVSEFISSDDTKREKLVFQGDENAQPDFAGYEYILERQLKPEARKDIVQQFKEKNILPTAMIDISDGLASEIMHICKDSGIGCNIYEEKIPIDYQTFKMAEELNMNATVCALSGGEDYELLFTAPLEHYDLLTAMPGISVIGHTCKASEGCYMTTRDGNTFELKAQGWQNFSSTTAAGESENKKAIPKNDFLPESCSAAMHIAQKRKSVRHHNLVLFNRTPASNCMTA